MGRHVPDADARWLYVDKGRAGPPDHIMRMLHMTSPRTLGNLDVEVGGISACGQTTRDFR
jgi:hypothetical protein